MTKRFEITASAVKEIRKQFAQSDYEDPVATIGQATEPLHATPEFRDAIRAERSGEELLELGRREFENRGPSLRFYLTVFVYEARECNAEDIVEVSGIKLAMRPSLLSALSGLLLDFGSEGFVFLGLDGSVQHPFSA